VTARYGPVEPLHRGHRTAAFDCGQDAQTEWLREHALQAHRAGTSRVYVTCPAGDDRVAGYHALAAGAVRADEVPERVGRGTGRHPIPVVVLTRLGVDRSHQGHGLGRALLVDALRRAAAAADTIGVRAVLIHCEDEASRASYVKQAAFEDSPTDPLHLMLLMKDLRAALG
jgi:GNAT superfamily N-acetyltransferase